MKTIVVPTDFSKYAGYALDFASQLALKTWARIKLIHIIEYPVVSPLNASGEHVSVGMEDVYTSEIIENAKKKLLDIKNDPKYEGIKIITDVKVGNPFQNIAQEITHTQSDLVVMGTKGSGGLEEIIIGSNAEKVVRFAKCPVFTIPEPANISNINKIVFATNMNEEESFVADEVKNLQKLFDAHLSLVWINTPHVIENEEVMKEKLKDFAKKHNFGNYSVNVYKSILADEGIINFAEELDADIIAMATHGRKGISHLFTGSIVEDIVNHANKPVWTLSLKANELLTT